MKQKVIIITEVPRDTSVHLWPEEFSLSSWEDRDRASYMLSSYVDLTDIEAIQLHHAEHISLRIITEEDTSSTPG
jgi:hypothetical protein